MKLSKISSLLILGAVLLPSANAYTLKESVSKVLSSNSEVASEKYNQKAFKKYIDAREGDYYPRIDVDSRIEKSRSFKNYNSSSKYSDGISDEDGYNIGVALNQIIYDGNLTPSRVAEAKYKYKSNKYRTKRNIENVVFNTTKAYLDLVKYNEMIALTQDMIRINQNNLKIARKQKKINNKVLDSYQVASKVNFLKEKYLEEQDMRISRINTFKRYVGVFPKGDEHKPYLDMSRIPKNLKEAVKQAVLNNTEVLEQIEKVKAQKEKIAQADAKFLPNLNLELKASTDNDLSLNEEGRENQLLGRISLKWNLYNGGSDYAVSTQEELFLKEQKKRLNAITNKVVEAVKVIYQRVAKDQKRIDVLKEYVKANEKIVRVYKQEFKAGSRTFVDILNAQTTLYEAKKSLLNREYEMYANYYELLNKMSVLSDSILHSKEVAPKVVKAVKAKEVKKAKTLKKHKKLKVLKRASKKVANSIFIK